MKRKAAEIISTAFSFFEMFSFFLGQKRAIRAALTLICGAWEKAMGLH